MALYLNNLDLNGNQLQKAVVHPLGTAPTSAQEGQIYYDTGDNVIYVNTSTTVNSPNWVNMQSGDLTGITITTDSGGGSAASDTSGNADFSLLGTSGVGVTNSGATITVTSVPGEIDHDSLLNFASNEHFTQANITTVGTIGTGVWQGTAIATAYIADDAVTEDKLANTLLAEIDANTAKATNATHTGDVTGSGALTIANDAVTLAKMQNISTSKMLGRVSANAGIIEELSAADVKNFLTISNVDNKSSATIRGEIVSANIPNNAADTTGNAATVTTNANLTGHITSSGNAAVLGSFTTAQLNAAISDGTINSQTLPTDFVSAANGGTFASAVTFTGNITANGNIAGDNATNVSGINIITAKEIDVNTAGSNTVLKIGDQASKSITLGKTATSGNSDGTSVSVENDLTVKGKLTVQGDLVTTSTSNTVIKDNIIQINDGGNASNNDTTQADMGIVMDRGTDGNVALNWDESDNAFKFIATGDTAASTTMTMTSQGGENNDENISGTASPAGYQDIYAAKFRAVGSAGTAGFIGNGASITHLNGSSIATGTVAVARGGTGVSSMTALKNALDGETWTFANTVTLSGSLNIGGHSVDDIDLAGQFVDSDNHLMSSAAINDRITSFGYTTNTGTTTAGNTQTFTSKSIDADNNTLSNIEVDNFKGSAIVTESEAIGSNDNDTTIPTSAAVKDYVDNATSSSGNTGGRQSFVLADATTGVAATSTTVFTITHGMGASRNYGVEIIRNSNNSGGGETVIVDVARPTDLTITVTFAVAPTAGDYTALVCKY